MDTAQTAPQRCLYERLSYPTPLIQNRVYHAASIPEDVDDRSRS